MGHKILVKLDWPEDKEAVLVSDRLYPQYNIIVLGTLMDMGLSNEKRYSASMQQKKIRITSSHSANSRFKRVH